MFCSSKQHRGLKEHSGSQESKPGMGVCLPHTILMLWITLNVPDTFPNRLAKGMPMSCPMPYPLQGPNRILLPKLRLRPKPKLKLKLDLFINRLPNQEAKKLWKAEWRVSNLAEDQQQDRPQTQIPLISHKSWIQCSWTMYKSIKWQWTCSA